MTDTTERWLSIKDFEGFYEVSSLGRVRSLDRVVMSRNRWGPIEKHLRSGILAQHVDDYGYLVVTLQRTGRKPRPYRVHRLVGEAFLGHLPKGMDTLHGPAGQLVNAVTNLHYGTRAENEQDKLRDGAEGYTGGSVAAGAAHWRAKLTDTKVVEIRRRWDANESRKAIAQIFGVSPATISKIGLRQTWRHVA